MRSLSPPTETQTILRTDSHGPMTALASQSTAAATDTDPRANAARVLPGESIYHAGDDNVDR